MKVIKSYTFQLQRDGKPIFPQFMVHELEDGEVQVSSIHPYDETEYHWASKSAGSTHWRILRNGKVVSIMSKPIGSTQPLTPEEIASILLMEDEKAHLTRTGGIW